ncbi:unnamed protein product, partial [Rotaria sp. Silwood1]
MIVAEDLPIPNKGSMICNPLVAPNKYSAHTTRLSAGIAARK